MTLQEALLEVEDPRRKKGLRINLQQMFSMIMLANLCGYFGGRPVARFVKYHEKALSEELNLKHRVPSHVTFSNLINRIDQNQFIFAFNKWASSYVSLKKGELVSGDGKALASTVSDKHGKNQDYQAIVSLFCQKSGLVHSLGEYRNGKKSEIGIVTFLVKKLKNMGITLFLDALHTQKKR
jgi:hypothetical protein